MRTSSPPSSSARLQDVEAPGAQRARHCAASAEPHMYMQLTVYKHHLTGTTKGILLRMTAASWSSSGAYPR
jgi:hypothetical protein